MGINTSRATISIATLIVLVLAITSTVASLDTGGGDGSFGHRKNERDECFLLCVNEKRERERGRKSCRQGSRGVAGGGLEREREEAADLGGRRGGVGAESGGRRWGRDLGGAGGWPREGRGRGRGRLATGRREGGATPQILYFPQKAAGWYTRSH
ncbi:hypothetical protein Salat_1980300 [Sesamum alatum]|uniref:Glycine-rich protein n=1 Tax=Sesamum alatum TaxID=300844 RepID=A0AAE1XZ79_9LAMI|nr:hypothetical protein Salat_1980300 [Sesamum alatum]